MDGKELKGLIGKRIKLTILENNQELFFTGSITSVDADGFFSFTDKFGLTNFFRVSNVVSIREAEK